METFQTWLKTEILLETQRGEETIASFEKAVSTKHPGAIDDFMRRIRSYIAKIVSSRVRDSNDQDDIIQQSQLTIYRSIIGELAQIKDPQKVHGWIGTIVSRTIIAHARQKKRQVPPQDDIESLVRHSRPQDNLIDELGEYLHPALASLGKMDKEVIVMFYFHSLSLKEIAGELGIPVGTVKRRLFSARQRLGKEIEQLKAT